MSEKAEIKTMNIKIGDLEITVTPKQAKQLHKVLNELFGRKIEPIIPTPIIIHEPYRWHYHAPSYTHEDKTGSRYDLYYSNTGGSGKLDIDCKL
jgi:hypothetical protein